MSATLSVSDFCAFITQNVPAKSHVITANEGNAVALATGYHLATGKTAMVYLQVCFANKFWNRFLKYFYLIFSSVYTLKNINVTVVWYIFNQMCSLFSFILIA